MLTDKEIQAMWNDCIRNRKTTNDFARAIERAVLAKALAQQERVHKEWSELWTPIDELVRPLTPLGESVAAKAVELISLGLAKAGEQKAKWSFCPECGCEEVHYENGNHKQCENCVQEWFSDIYYTDTARGNLSRLFERAKALPAQAIPEGWQLVPIEPTKEMCDAYCEHSIAPIGNLSRYGYKAMLSASPKP